MHQHYQNKLTARTKIYHKLNKRQRLVRQQKASADKKKNFDGIYILVLIYEINVRNYRISSNKHP